MNIKGDGMENQTLSEQSIEAMLKEHLNYYNNITFDDKLNELSRRVVDEFNKEECKQIFDFIKKLNSLDDSALKKVIHNYYSDKDMIDTFFLIIKSFKFEEFQTTFPKEEFHILALFMLPIFSIQHKGEELMKMQNAVVRIMNLIELQALLYELQNDTNFVLINNKYQDILLKVYGIGVLEGSINLINKTESFDLQQKIHSLMSYNYIKNTTNFKTVDKLKQIIRQIADDKYKNGSKREHHDMALYLHTQLTFLKDGFENKIEDEVLLKYIPQLKEYDLKKYEKHISRKVIRETILPVAACYNRASGISSEAMRKKLCLEWQLI